jgi:2-amino-4-hydroxy-6-hydroxymethyldihydropteridine diphosphokinase
MFMRLNHGALNSNNKFLNMVAKVNTYLSPFVLMKKLQAIEIRLGRTRSLTRYTSRSIDIDLLFYGSRIIRERMLTVPHPLITDRKFVLVPLCDIAPKEYILF